MSRLSESPSWQALARHKEEISGLQMRDLFARDPQRFEIYSLRLGDFLFDYSKNQITEHGCSHHTSSVFVLMVG